MKLDMINVGRIVNTHGIRGEVRVQPRDGDPQFLTAFKTFYIDGKPVTPTANHVHKSLVLMKFPGVDDMDSAIAWKDKVLYIRREDAALPEGEYFDDELLGVEVFDEATGELLGEIKKVESYPASKIYTVKGEKEYLIPAVEEFLIETNVEEGFLRVHLLEGM